MAASNEYYSRYPNSPAAYSIKCRSIFTVNLYSVQRGRVVWMTAWLAGGGARAGGRAVCKSLSPNRNSNSCWLSPLTDWLHEVFKGESYPLWQGLCSVFSVVLLLILPLRIKLSRWFGLNSWTYWLTAGVRGEGEGRSFWTLAVIFFPKWQNKTSLALPPSPPLLSHSSQSLLRI